MPLPGDYQAFLTLTPQAIQSLTDELVQRPLSAETIEGWLHDWTDLAVLFQESLARLDIAADVNTANTEAAEKRRAYRQTIWPIDDRFNAAMEARLFEHEAMLPQNLLPHIAKMKRYRSQNHSDELIALVNQEQELAGQYGALLGAQSIEWQGQTLSNRQARGMLGSEDEAVREGIRRALLARRQQDSAAITDIWRKLLDVRQAIAQKNGFSNYLDYRWQEMERYDYTPDDSRALHKAFQDHWSPLYERIMAQRKEESPGEEKVQPFTDGADLVAKVGRLFHRLDPEFGAQYDHALELGLLDITTRVNTAPVGGFARAVGRTGVFVMLNVSPGDIAGLIHEMGHSFSLVATGRQPYHFFYGFPYDFGETPSSVMEMLSLPYWDEFYQGAALEQNKQGYFAGVLLSSLQDVMIEAFQLWIYSHPDEAHDPANCTAQWLELHQTYLPNGEWQAHQDETALGWQYSAAPFYAPLFAMEYVYGRLAGLNLLKMDDAAARYKQAIALGNSVSAKDLFTAIGTRFFFTADDVAAAANQLEAESYPLKN